MFVTLNHICPNNWSVTNYTDTLIWAIYYVCYLTVNFDLAPMDYTCKAKLLFLHGHCMRHDLEPIGTWALARTIYRNITEPKSNGKPISFWMHDKQAHTNQVWPNWGYIYSKQPMISAARYCLEEYRCQLIFWRLEPIPTPLPLLPIKHIPW